MPHASTSRSLSPAIRSAAHTDSREAARKRRRAQQRDDLRLEGDESEWVSSWEGIEEQAPPAAIRVTIDGLGFGDSYWIQEIPIMAVVYSLGTYDSDLGGYFEDDAGFGFRDEDDFDD